ncbi:MAG: adenosylcobalamin-dependent ribonucleoside-diphosphate reductase [Anaerolineales bacterium]|nr:adenosylcobalamin-dependent ribonucleoside-diphosphate reductase [Anaerolineales bacterium]
MATKIIEKNNDGLLPTPTIPESLPAISLSENAMSVFTRRYSRKAPDGKPVESTEETFWRVAYHVAKAEERYGKDVLPQAERFYRMLAEKRFYPNSPTFTGAGTPIGQLAACFVLPISDDMGKDPDGIFQTLRNAALIQQTGGGNGFSFSQLRPKGSLVKSSSGKATGPVGFLRVYDQAFGEVAQGGTRRGANMAVLRVDHPDIEEFITCKTEENAISNFNISIGITDAFMEAVRDDKDWDLRFLDRDDSRTKNFSGTLEDAEEENLPIKVYKTVNARGLFSKIVKQAHHNGEPGILFLDAANRSNPVPQLYRLEATNPCGEQWLGPYENCCLGSINLAQHLAEAGQVDWVKLEDTIQSATMFLDDVVDENAYVPAVPELKEAALRARRIGLGIMGLADLLYHAGIRYGSREGQEFSTQVMEFVRYHSMKTSIALAKERGAFPAISGSIYDPENIVWEYPKPLTPYMEDFNRPALDWDGIVIDIKTYGIRNAAQTTVAPTGTIATVSGCEGYGCEPVFALAYIRHVNDNGKDLQLTYTSPMFEAALIKAGISEEMRANIVQKVTENGTCQEIMEIPADLRNTFVVSSDISAEEHVRMQAAMQAFVDNSMSKTINFPETAEEGDVALAYITAWELGCKGITVYVTGSRDTVVLETNKTAQQKESDSNEVVQDTLWNENKKPRPKNLHGATYQIDTPVGKAFVTINHNGGHQPFEVFLNTAKAGSETAAVSEAIGRLISYILRISSPVSPRDRLKEVHRQLNNIGGGRSLGFGINRVRSLPDGVAKILVEYLEATEDVFEQTPVNGKDPLQYNIPAENSAKGKGFNPTLKGDLCPECGEAAVINEEGCRKCYSCGYSEC